MNEFNCLDVTTPVSGHHFLEASAGTGKTFAIEHTVLRLVAEEGYSLEKILAVTFTRAATRDLRKRITATLRRELDGEDSLLTEEGKHRIRGALKTIDSLQVYTIHGFCHAMLDTFAIQSGLPLNSEHPDDGPDDVYTNNLLLDFLRTQTVLHPQQLRILLKKYRSIEGLVRKLRQITSPLIEIPHGVPYQELEARFAAYVLPDGVIEEVEELAPYYKGLVGRDGTLKEAYASQVKELKKGITLSSALSWDIPIFSLFTEENEKKKGPPRKPSAIIKVQEALVPLLYQATRPAPLFATLAYAAQNYLKTHQDIDEKISPDLLLQRMNEACDQSRFLNAVRPLFDAVIVDEFQDTDPLQWGIFSKLFFSNDYKIETLFLVGDPKQSIYGFRNADVGTYLSAKASFDTTAHKKLTTNYRSHPHVISGLNALFSHPLVGSWMKVPKQDTAVAYEPVFAGRGGGEMDEPPLVFMSEDVEGYVVSEIKLLQQRGIPLSECVVLVRDRFQGEAMQAALKKSGIFSFMRQHTLLHETQVFELFSRIYAACIDPFDDATFIELLLHPLVGGSIDTIQMKGTVADKRALFDATLSKYVENGFLAALYTFFHTQWFLDTPENNMVLGGSLEHISAQKHLYMCLRQGLSLKQVAQKEIPVQQLMPEEAVQIMTIHTSKGLEFSYVFALGIAKGYTLKDLLIQVGPKAVVVDSQAESCKTALQEVDAEKLRLLYVALTRAKERVYIPLPDDKDPGSPIELLFNGQTDEIVRSLIESGYAIMGVPSPTNTVPLVSEATTPLLLSTENCHWEKGLSFSSIASPKVHMSHQVDEDELPQGAEVGTIVHELLEKTIENGLYSPFSHAEVEEEVRKAIQYTACENFQEKLVTILQHCFTQTLPELEIALDAITPSQMITEVDFFYTESGATYKGVIDLLFYWKGSWYIIDWKTTALPDYEKETLQKSMEEHEYTLQAEMYAKAVKKHGVSLGGVFYVFVRGLEQGKGVLFHELS